MQIKSKSIYHSCPYRMDEEVSCSLLLCCLILPVFAGDQLIGTPAPEWSNRQCDQFSASALSQLKGKVILVRFFYGILLPLLPHDSSLSHPVLYAKYRNRGCSRRMYTPKPGPRETPIESEAMSYVITDFNSRWHSTNDWSTLNTVLA